MAGRIAVVTGGMGGLGTAICRTLAGLGATVVAADLGDDSRQEEFLRGFTGSDVHALPLDVTSFDGCAAFVRTVESRFGALDILVNGAGITRDATLRKMAREHWDAVLSTNLDGAFNLCRHAVGGMVDRGFGRIVNISSVNGQTGQFGQTNYAAAKAGLHGLTMSLAREVARKGVTVNSISPGYIDTPMVRAMPEEMREGIVATIPVARMGVPDDIARTVAFLAADDAGYVTGANIPVNGGLYMGF